MQQSFVFILRFVQLWCMGYSVLVSLLVRNISADTLSRYYENVTAKLSVIIHTCRLANRLLFFVIFCQCVCVCLHGYGFLRRRILLGGSSASKAGNRTAEHALTPTLQLQAYRPLLQVTRPCRPVEEASPTSYISTAQRCWVWQTNTLNSVK